MKQKSLWFLCLTWAAYGMLFPELRVCNYTRFTVAYQVLAIDEKTTECVPWSRLEADFPFQCQTVKLFDSPCHGMTMDSMLVNFDSDRRGRCVIPQVKVTSPGKIDVFVETEEPEQGRSYSERQPMNCRWLYH